MKYFINSVQVRAGESWLEIMELGDQDAHTKADLWQRISQIRGEKITDGSSLERKTSRISPLQRDYALISGPSQTYRTRESGYEAGQVLDSIPSSLQSSDSLLTKKTSLFRF